MRPGFFAVDIVTEFHHMQAWAIVNRLSVNPKKTKGNMNMFRQSTVRSHYIVLPIDDADLISSVNNQLFFRQNFKVDVHINFVLS